MRRAVAGAAVSSEEGCSSTGAVERGGAAAGTGEGAGIALGHKSKTGYLGVRRNQRSGLTGIRPYQAQVWRGGKNVSLGAFANAEEAAL